MRPINVVVAYIVTLSVLVGCGEVIVPPPELPYSNTPAEVLEQIEDSFLARDISELEGLLAADFTFHFNDDDVGKLVGGYTIPELWDSTDFLGTVERLFNQAHSIDISIVTTYIDDPGPDDTTYIADNVQMQFLVMVTVVGGYSAQGFVTFEFGAVYNEKNEKEWLVAAWRDFTSPAGSGGRYITPASFGEILARFHKP